MTNFDYLLQNLALLDVREDEEKLVQLQNKFTAANIIFLVTDITKRDVLEQTFKTVLEKFQQIDVVVNSAGILREKDLELVVATNLVRESVIFEIDRELNKFFQSDRPHQLIASCNGRYE